MIPRNRRPGIRCRCQARFANGSRSRATVQAEPGRRRGSGSSIPATRMSKLGGASRRRDRSLLELGVLQHAESLGERARARIGRLPGQQPKQRGTQSVNVRRRSDRRRIAALLGRHVFDRAQEISLLRPAVVVLLHQSEVDELDDAGVAQKQVRRLDVPMDQAVTMRFVKTVRRLPDPFARGRNVDGTAPDPRANRGRPPSTSSIRQVPATRGRRGPSTATWPRVKAAVTMLGWWRAARTLISA